MSPETKARGPLRQHLRARTYRVVILRRRFQTGDPELVLGLDRVEADASAADEPHSHDHSHPELNADGVSLEGRVSREPLEQLLREAISSMGLLRLKGRVPIAGKALPLQIQAVGRRLECWFEADGEPADQLKLVLIGVAPDAAALKQQLQQLMVA